MSTKKDIEKQFDTWNRALKTGNPDNVVPCYAEDAILLPTVSARVRHNHEEIRDYFEHFLTKKPVGKISEQNIRIYGEIAINSGLYTFTFTDGGITTDAAARFTFVYRKHENGWLIIEHHSSIVPA
jgi:uncharacterized protein (TIGR02246 family)